MNRHQLYKVPVLLFLLIGIQGDFLQVFIQGTLRMCFHIIRDIPDQLLDIFQTLDFLVFPQHVQVAAILQHLLQQLVNADGIHQHAAFLNHRYKRLYVGSCLALSDFIFAQDVIHIRIIMICL